MPLGTECAPVCNTPFPSMCMGNDIVCDMGMDEQGCWMGDYCLAEGAICPDLL